MPIESDIKQQYAKFFTKTDSRVFKWMAEYYFRKAATLLIKDIDSGETDRLLLRNVQKRLFIGIGCELLLKSFFLLQDYCINLPVRGYTQPGKSPYSIKTVQQDKFDISNTLTLNNLIQKLPKIQVFANCPSVDKEQMLKAFNIAKVFRNKEGHVATLWHDYDSTNYSDIESGLVLFYKTAFSQKLAVSISFESNEKGEFVIASL
jgi:hypothetical protein